ncbi:hypothetical protein MBANPS3_007503 [Mucor bainieri]
MVLVNIAASRRNPNLTAGDTDHARRRPHLTSSSPEAGSSSNDDSEDDIPLANRKNVRHRVRNASQFFVHAMVAAAWYPNEVNIQKEVHHVNHKPLDNHYSNLKWLSREEHAEIHIHDDREHAHQFKKKKLKSVCSLCPEDIIESNVYQCECKKFFCGVHRESHQTGCFYYIERNNT